MNTNRLNMLITERSTLFIYDRAKRFSSYICSLLDEKVFPAPKEKAELLSGISLSKARKPYFLAEEDDFSPIVSFAQKGDILLYVYLNGDASKIRDLFCAAKALGLNTILITSSPLEEVKDVTDYLFTFDKNQEAIGFCSCLCDSLSSSTAATVSLPYPIENCGLSHCAFGKNLNEKAFSDYKENGISHMEISFGRYEDTVSLDFKEYKRLADKYGITLWSFHLPFMPFTTLNPAHFDETVRRFTVSYFIELMKEAKRDAGISIFVMHPSGEPIHEDDRTTSFKQLQKSIAELTAFTQQNGLTLAIENLPRTCLGRSIEDMQKILSYNPHLKMCFDINHTGTESPAQVIKRFGNRIITLHVSDYMGKDECHIMPGEGVVDWVEVIRALKAADYKGPFLYEVSRGVEEDGAIWAKEAWHTRLFTRERFLTHSDVKENFITLMNKSK